MGEELRNLEEVELVAGLMARLPASWNFARDSVEGEGLYWIQLNRGSIRAEIQAFSPGGQSINTAIRVLKYNALKLLSAANLTIKPHDLKHPQELLMDDPDSQGLILYQFSETNPILLMTARGLTYEDLDEIRYLFGSISLDSSQAFVGNKLQELDLIDFDWTSNTQSNYSLKSSEK